MVQDQIAHVAGTPLVSGNWTRRGHVTDAYIVNGRHRAQPMHRDKGSSGNVEPYVASHGCLWPLREPAMISAPATAICLWLTNGTAYAVSVHPPWEYCHEGAYNCDLDAIRRSTNNNSRSAGNRREGVDSLVSMVQSKAKRSSAACQQCIIGPLGEWCPVECCRERCGTRKRSNFAQCVCDCSAGLWDSASKTCY